jgi:NitT/TauT family transport system substrate-binding protein
MKRTTAKILKAAIAAIAIAAMAGPVLAQDIRIAKQLQINNLPSMIIENQKLFEKHATELGEPEMKAKWLTFANGGATTDALISGNVEFVSAGLTNFVILWSRTKGNVRGVAGVAGIPLPLLTRNPDIKSLKDFTANDRIAVPTVKVSNQAVMLSMGLEKLYGEKGRTKLDNQTVQLSHSDALQALLNPQHEVNTHFSTPPYSVLEMRNPKVHKVFDSADLSDVPVVSNIMFATKTFHDSNPVAVKAMIAAMDEANAFINKDKKAAAELYLKVSGDKITVDEVVAVLNQKGTVFSATPQGTLPIAQFMYRAGIVPTQPEKWDDLYFPEVASRQGS